MSMSTRTRTPRLLAAGAAVAIAALLSACSQGAAPGGTQTRSGGADAAEGVAYAKAQLEKYESTTAADPAGEPVEIGDRLKGKVVWDIVYLGIVPGFQASFKAIQTAAVAMGGTAQLCDAKATPSGANACMEQAVNAGAAAIFLDNVKVKDVPDPFEDAKAKKIPVVTLDQLPTTTAGPTELAYSPFPQIPIAKLNADYVIATSGGKANVMMTEIADDPTAKTLIDTATKEFDTYCGDCSLVTVQTKATATDQIPSVVSTGLLKNPSTDWLIPEFDNFASLAQQGVQQSGRDAGAIKGVSGGGSLGAVQDVAAGGFLDAVVGENVNYAGWLAMNLLVHMMVGKPVPYEDSQQQLTVFTKESASKLTLTAEAYSSGEWYGSTAYQDAFLKHWGVAS